MDLSKWDEVALFTKEQIAHLLAGVAPGGGPYSTATEKQIRLYRKLLAAGAESASKHAQKFASGITEHPDFIAPDLFEFDSWGGELPSYELRCKVAKYLHNPKLGATLVSFEPGDEDRFNRDDIADWAIGKGLTKGYSFDDSAPESVVARVEQEGAAQDGNFDRREFAFSAQLEALLQRYWGFADALLGDRDVERLDRIGTWQRISMLDKTEDGKEFLTDSDAELLAQVGRQGSVTYVLEGDQSNREWRCSSDAEKWIAFGVHVYGRIVSGVSSIDESYFLFRLASELVGFLERGDPEQLKNEIVTLRARAAANARHSKPGGSRDKKQQIQEIWLSGKYSSRDVCAEQECAALGMSFSTARKALRGTEEPPSRCR